MPKNLFWRRQRDQQESTAYLGPFHTSMMQLSCKNIFLPECIIIDVWYGSKYASNNACNTPLRMTDLILTMRFSKASLNHFVPLVFLYTPWKHQKTSGFLMFSGSIQRDWRHEMGFWLNIKATSYWADWKRTSDYVSKFCSAYSCNQRKCHEGVSPFIPTWKHLKI